MSPTEYVRESGQAPVSKERNAFFVLKSFNFFFYATVAFLLPFLPLYFQSIGLSTIQIGILLSIGPFISLVANPFWGFVSDRMQTVKKVLFVVLLMNLLTGVLLFQVQSFVLLLGIVLLFYFFQTTVPGLTDSLIFQTIQGTGTSYASIRIWGSLGFFFTALAIAPIFKQVGVSYLGIFYPAAVVVALFSVFGLPDRKAAAHKVSLKGALGLFENKLFVWFLFLIVLIMTPHRLNDSFIGLHLKSLGASELSIGWVMAVAALTEIPVFLYLGRYMHKFKELPLLLLASFFYLLRWLLMGFVDDPGWIFVIQMMQGVTFGLYFYAAVHFCLKLVPDHYRSTGQALFTVVHAGLTGIIGGWLGGWLIDAYGAFAMYRFGAGLTFIAVLSLVGTYIYLRRRGAVLT